MEIIQRFDWTLPGRYSKRNCDDVDREDLLLLLILIVSVAESEQPIRRLFYLFDLELTLGRSGNLSLSS